MKRWHTHTTKEFAIQVGPLKFKGKGRGLIGECLAWSCRAGAVEYDPLRNPWSWSASGPSGQALGSFETRHEAMLAVLNWWLERKKVK